MPSWRRTIDLISICVLPEGVVKIEQRHPQVVSGVWQLWYWYPVVAWPGRGRSGRSGIVVVRHDTCPAAPVNAGVRACEHQSQPYMEEDGKEKDGPRGPRVNDIESAEDREAFSTIRKCSDPQTGPTTSIAYIMTLLKKLKNYNGSSLNRWIVMDFFFIRKNYSGTS